MPINSKAKGNAGERDFCSFMREKGFDAERSQQYCGNVDAPDIKSTLFKDYHPEVKRTESTMFYAWMKKAEEEVDATKKIPIIFHRQNRGKWMAFIDASELLNLIAIANDLRDYCRDDLLAGVALAEIK